MSGNESSSSDRERSPSLIRSNNDQGRRSKEVSPNLGEPLKEHPKRTRPKSRSKSSNNKSTDEERIPWTKRRWKKSKKRHRSKSKKNKRKDIGDIHVRHHHQARLMTILMRVNIEIMKARKTKITDLEFLRWISTITAYLQTWSNTATLILILKSKRQT